MFPVYSYLTGKGFLQPRSVRGRGARGRGGFATPSRCRCGHVGHKSRSVHSPAAAPFAVRIHYWGAFWVEITTSSVGLQISRSRSVGATVFVSYARLRVVSKSRCSKSSYPFVFFGVRIFVYWGCALFSRPQSHRFGGAGRQSRAPDLDLGLEDCSMAFMVLLLDCHDCYQHYCCFLIAPA